MTFSLPHFEQTLVVIVSPIGVPAYDFKNRTAQFLLKLGYFEGVFSAHRVANSNY